MRATTAAAAAAGAVCCVLACDFSDSWARYCGYAGRCTTLDAGVARKINNGVVAGVVTQVRQGGGDVEISLYGGNLDFRDQCQIVVVPDRFTPFNEEWAPQRVKFTINVPSGAPEGMVYVHLFCKDDRVSDWESRDAGTFLQITPLVVVRGAAASGVGTYDNPYCCWATAASVADAGDTIFLRGGTYDSETWSQASPGSLPTNISLIRGVHLRGEPDGGTVLASTIGAAKAAFDIQTPDHTISDLRITGFYRGINVGFSGPGDVTLRNVVIEGAEDRGMWTGLEATVDLDSVRVDGTRAGPNLEVSASSTVRAGNSTFTAGGGTLGAVLVSDDGGLYLRGSSIISNQAIGLRVDTNGQVHGEADAGGGGNTLNNDPFLEILDDRPATRGVGIRFSETSLRNKRPDAGQVGSNTEYGIQVINPGNYVQFY